MPGKLLNLVSASSSSAKNKIKSSLHNVGQKAAQAPSHAAQLHQNFARRNRDPESMDLLRRHKLTLLAASRRRDSSTSRSPAPTKKPPATVDIAVESPPLVSYGPAATSSGALFSGQLVLNVAEKTTFSQIEVRLLCATSVRKPIVKDCPDCHSRNREMKTWNFAVEPRTLDAGEHKFPVSFLFAGSLPATMSSHLCIVDYHFAVHARTKDGVDIRLSKTIELGRAFHPGSDRNSVRVFPPTNVTANMTHNPVIYDSGEIPMVLKLEGMSRTERSSQLRWRLRRLVWRVQETEKVVSNPCPRHTDKVPAGSPGLQHEHTRLLGELELDRAKTPWKTDSSTGAVYAEFAAKLNTVRGEAPTNDENAPDRGILVSHALVVEMVVVEESSPLGRAGAQGIPTGAARILRATFPLTLTRRGGMGVAWDEETPPVYQDVPPSPPRYQNGDTGPGGGGTPSSGNGSAVTVALAELADEPGFEDLRLGEPHERARATALRASASTVVPAVGRSSEDSVGGVRRGSSNVLRLSADDLLSEPPGYGWRPDEEAVEEDDVQVGTTA
jgi:arrestin-related trafficking adapter 1